MTVHDISINKLVNSLNLKKTGFLKELKELAKKEENSGCEDIECIDCEFSLKGKHCKCDGELFIDDYCRIIPDAFKICEFCKVILCYEVEDSHKLDMDKLKKYALLWDYIPEWADWELVLVSVGRYGDSFSLVDLEPYWIECIKDSAKYLKQKVSWKEYHNWCKYWSEKGDNSENN